MQSYLESTFLQDATDMGYDGTDTEGSTVAMTPALGEAPAQDLVTLPGGIVIPRKTLMLLLGAVLAVAAVWYLRRQKQKQDV